MITKTELGYALMVAGILSLIYLATVDIDKQTPSNKVYQILQFSTDRTNWITVTNEVLTIQQTNKPYILYQRTIGAIIKYDN